VRGAVAVLDRVRTAVADRKAPEPMHPYHVRRFLRLTVAFAVLVGAIIAGAAVASSTCLAAAPVRRPR
jgi:hypothetical protein